MVDDKNGTVGGKHNEERYRDVSIPIFKLE